MMRLSEEITAKVIPSYKNARSKYTPLFMSDMKVLANKTAALELALSDVLKCFTDSAQIISGERIEKWKQVLDNEPS